MSNVLVEYQGQRYLWLREDDRDEGALAYMHHVDADGHIKPECVLEMSFAHVIDGIIFRQRRRIGVAADLKRVAADAK